MLQQPDLDRVFQALADPTRRAIVERLVTGGASVSELAAPFDVTLAAIGQHVQVLETSGLVRTRKVGRVRTVEIDAAAFGAAERWFESHRKRWQKRLDRLGDLLAEEDEQERPAARPKKPNPTSRKP